MQRRASILAPPPQGPTSRIGLLDRVSVSSLSCHAFPSTGLRLSVGCDASGRRTGKTRLAQDLDHADLVLDAMLRHPRPCALQSHDPSTAPSYGAMSVPYEVLRTVPKRSQGHSLQESRRSKERLGYRQASQGRSTSSDETAGPSPPDQEGRGRRKRSAWARSGVEAGPYRRRTTSRTRSSRE